MAVPCCMDDPFYHDGNCLFLVGDFHRFVGSSVLSVQGPGNLLRSFQLQLVGLEGLDKLRIQLTGHQTRDNLLKLNDIGRLVNQDHLKKAVVQADIVSGDLLETAHGLGICDHAVGKITLELPLLRPNLHMVASDIKEPLGSLQKVSHMAEHVLRLLAGLICHICKKAESRDINKILVVKSAHIKASGSS